MLAWHSRAQGRRTQPKPYVLPPEGKATNHVNRSAKIRVIRRFSDSGEFLTDSSVRANQAAWKAANIRSQAKQCHHLKIYHHRFSLVGVRSLPRPTRPSRLCGSNCLAADNRSSIAAGESSGGHSPPTHRRHQAPASRYCRKYSTNPQVEVSCSALTLPSSSSFRITPASCFPSSTPHWS